MTDCADALETHRVRHRWSSSSRRTPSARSAHARVLATPTHRRCRVDRAWSWRGSARSPGSSAGATGCLPSRSRTSPARWAASASRAACSKARARRTPPRARRCAAGACRSPSRGGPGAACRGARSTGPRQSRIERRLEQSVDAEGDAARHREPPPRRGSARGACRPAAASAKARVAAPRSRRGGRAERRRCDGAWRPLRHSRPPRLARPPIRDHPR